MGKRNKFTSLLLIVFALVILLPMLTILIWAFTERWAWPDLWPQVHSTRAIQEIMGRKNQIFQLFISSILLSTAVAALSVVIGTMTARALIFYEFKGKGIFYFLSIMPFMVPTTVFAMGIQVVFIKAGLHNTVYGVIIAHLIYSLPYAIRLLIEGTKGVGKELEEQAKVLGAAPWQAFYKVTLPLLVPALLSSFSMAYIVSFSQYFITLLIGGGKVKTFTMVMVPYLQSGDRNIASIYSSAFLGITLVIFGAFEWIANKYSKNYNVDYYA
jgi:putative spermidine/putrescine transport system permease protein